jgi:hypothetical protein
MRRASNIQAIRGIVLLTIGPVNNSAGCGKL